MLTALAKRPEERFPSAGDFRTALAALRGNFTVPVPAAEPVETAPVEAMPGATAPQFLMHAEPRGLQKKAFLLSFLCVAIGLIVLFFATTH